MFIINLLILLICTISYYLVYPVGDIFTNTNERIYCYLYVSPTTWSLCTEKTPLSWALKIASHHVGQTPKWIIGDRDSLKKNNPVDIFVTKVSLSPAGLSPSSVPTSLFLSRNPQLHGSYRLNPRSSCQQLDMVWLCLERRRWGTVIHGELPWALGLTAMLKKQTRWSCVSFHLHEMSRKDPSKERGSRWVVAWECGGVMAEEHRGSSWGDGNVLELDWGNVYTTLKTY